jgi:hypothetical protein
LAQAASRQSLPDDYTDVTEGLLAGLKRRIKRKLLGNFKHAYVDVLSRQQSAFNESLVRAVEELAECFALLDHAARAAPQPDSTGQASRERAEDHAFLAASIEKLVAQGRADELAVLVQSLRDELAESRTAMASLEARLARLEAQAAVPERHEASPE